MTRLHETAFCGLLSDQHQAVCMHPRGATFRLAITLEIRIVDAEYS